MQFSESNYFRKLNMSGKQFDFQDWMIHIQAGFQTRDTKSNLANLLALTKKDSGKSSEDVFYMDKIGNIGFYREAVQKCHENGRN